MLLFIKFKLEVLVVISIQKYDFKYVEGKLTIPAIMAIFVLHQGLICTNLDYVSFLFEMISYHRFSYYEHVN